MTLAKTKTKRTLEFSSPFLSNLALNYSAGILTLMWCPISITMEEAKFHKHDTVVSADLKSHQSFCQHLSATF